jgi:hypothetical protein
MRRVVLQPLEGGSDDGVTMRPVPAGRSGLGSGEPRPQRGDEQEIEQPVQNGLLPGLVADDLVGQVLDEPSGLPLAREHQHLGQSAEQASTDLGVQLIGADQQLRRALRRIAPGTGAEPRHRRDQPERGGADLAGSDHGLRRPVELIGHDVRPRPADDREVTGAAGLRRLPVPDRRVTGDDRDQRQRRLVLDADRPRRLEHTAQQERVASAGTVEQSGEGIHGRSVDPSSLSG